MQQDQEHVLPMRPVFTMNYQEAWKFLDNLQFFKIKLGLDSMTEFLDSLGHPQKDLRFVHVAGTNGKGSVCVTLLSMLAAAGYSVGLYTSPHLHSVRERFRINDTYISRDEFAAQASRIREILNGRQITYFEFTTALALLWFVERRVDLAILEVGMGGRLDATNVIRPLVSVITNVSMDHEAYLGDTLDAISAEKAGIIKADVPVVSGALDAVPCKVIERTCQTTGAPLYLLGREFVAESDADGSFCYRGVKGAAQRYRLSAHMKGAHQITNSALALATLEFLSDAGYGVDVDAARKGLSAVRWPGRLEYFNLEGPAQDGAEESGSLRQYLLDGAHNPAGVETLLRALRRDFAYQKLFLVWGCMEDKDAAASLNAIAPLPQKIIFTRPQGERSADPSSLAGFLPESSRSKSVCIPVVADALKKARELAGPDDLICVAGSLYLVGEVRFMLLGKLVNGV